MARAGITKAGITKVVFGLAAAGLLAGCVDSQGGAGASGEAGFAAPAAKKKGAAQDVEAPDVFQTTDSALWDGRPSLGGIWVASSEVTNPERAVLFNPATGKSVTGALFKRERENPGPKLQLSSDAAEALGILAGQPTEIRVTALRKAETEEPEVAEATAAAASEGQDDAAAAPADAAAIATAALDAVDAEKAGTASGAKAAIADGSDGNAAAAATVAAGTAAVAAGAADGGVAAIAEAPKRKTWKERRAEAKAAREAKRRAAAEAKAAAAAGAAVAASPDGSEPAATPEAAAVAEIATAPLDARKPEVASGTAEKPKRRTVGEAPAAAAAAAAPADDSPAAAAPAVAGGPVRPIQVASFSKEDNARRAAEALAKIGVTATPQKSEKAGKAVWGVVVQGDEAMLKKIKDAGFADAYFLK